MLSPHFRYAKQERANRQCQNTRRNRLGFSSVKFSYPRGAAVVLPKGIWMQTFPKFPGDTAPNTTHRSDVGRHLLQPSVIPIAQALQAHWKSTLHLPPPCWALALPQPHIGFFLLLRFVTVGLPYSFIQMSSSIKFNKETGNNVWIKCQYFFRSTFLGG